MKKYLTNILKYGWRALCIVNCIFAILYISFYLLGVWRINIGKLTMSFDSTTGCSVFVIALASLLRNDVDSILSRNDANLGYKSRKKYRRIIRLIIRVIWCIVFGAIFALGQINHLHDQFAYLGSLGLIDLGIVVFYGLFFATVVPMPEQEESEDEDKDSLDSAML